MSVRYADRGFVSINGSPIVDIKSVSAKKNRNARPVGTMTRDGFNRGFVQGNTEIDLTLAIAVANDRPLVKLDRIDYEANDVQLTLVVGQEQYIYTGLFLKDDDLSNPNVGDESTASYNMGALKFTDAVGNPVDFILELV